MAMTVRGDMTTMKRIVDDFERACKSTVFVGSPLGHDPLEREEILNHHAKAKQKLISMIRVFVEVANA
jgi:hypothetical protein